MVKAEAEMMFFMITVTHCYSFYTYLIFMKLVFMSSWIMNCWLWSFLMLLHMFFYDFP